MSTISPRPGPNDTLPCGTPSARRRHLAHGQLCATCDATDEPRPAPGPAVDPEPLLTARELEVLALIATDLTYRAIGRRLGVSVDTAKTHGLNLARKLGAHSRAHAVARAYQLGLIAAPRVMPGDQPLERAEAA